ncbi:hypothetical protein LXA43DRAFT_1101993 [Ganoderma leucocontextum]|nr:hypothetical protein LXA43DRAFT_1101993 [Ganoderma leucocontextum]
MALFQQPLIDYSVPGLHFTRGADVRVPVRVIVAQLSPHDYGIIVAKIVEGVLCDNPPEVLSCALIGHGTTFDTFERSRTVDVHPGEPHAFSLRHAFSLAFDEEEDFWGFMSSISEAKTMAIIRLSDMRDKVQQVLTSVLTVGASPKLSPSGPSLPHPLRYPRFLHTGIDADHCHRKDANPGAFDQLSVASTTIVITRRLSYFPHVDLFAVEFHLQRTDVRALSSFATSLWFTSVRLGVEAGSSYEASASVERTPQ